MEFDFSFKSSTDYIFKKKIGSGGLADVYLFIRKTEGCPDQQVALKVLKDNKPESVQELINEAEKLKQLKHPAVLSVLGFEKTEQNKLAIVLEYIDGTNLKELVSIIKPTEKENVVRYIASRLVEALAEAHQSGIIHGDISARNVLVAKNGEIKLSDFGISKNEEENLRQKNKGSIDYLSPQRWMGFGPSKQADLFALGMIIYELLTGANPLTAKTVEETQTCLQNFMHDKKWKDRGAYWDKFFDHLFEQKGDFPTPLPFAAARAKRQLTLAVLTALQKENSFTQTMTILFSQINFPLISVFQRAVFIFLFVFAFINPVAVSNDADKNQFKRPCMLTVTSQPWGEVFINNKSAGYTPVINLPLKAGYQEFMWRNFQGREVKKSLRAFNNGILSIQIR